jgi:hypothetical protein
METFDVSEITEDPFLRWLITTIIRRRAQGFAPVAVISTSEEGQVVSDTSIHPDEYGPFLASLAADPPVEWTETLDQ